MNIYYKGFISGKITPNGEKEIFKCGTEEELHTLITNRLRELGQSSDIHALGKTPSNYNQRVAGVGHLPHIDIGGLTICVLTEGNFAIFKDERAIASCFKNGDILVRDTQIPRIIKGDKLAQYNLTTFDCSMESERWYVLMDESPRIVDYRGYPTLMDAQISKLLLQTENLGLNQHFNRTSDNSEFTNYIQPIIRDVNTALVEKSAITPGAQVLQTAIKYIRGKETS